MIGMFLHEWDDCWYHRELPLVKFRVTTSFDASKLWKVKGLQDFDCLNSTYSM